MDLHHHVSVRDGRHPEMAAALADQPLKRAEIHAKLSGGPAVARGIGRPLAKPKRAFRPCRASDFRHRDERVRSPTDVRVPFDEFLIDGYRGQLESSNVRQTACVRVRTRQD